ncbi:MAG: hypothetical protein HOV68_15930, partial [Streptomycetaceae bacterium]|nr:hypothetical protein [Streptomycetaceae bacterium]
MLIRGIATAAALLAVPAALVSAGPAVSAPEGPAPRVSPGIVWGGCPADLPHSL